MANSNRRRISGSQAVIIAATIGAIAAIISAIIMLYNSPANKTNNCSTNSGQVSCTNSAVLPTSLEAKERDERSQF